MIIKNKKAVLITIIILLVSAGYVASRFGIVFANKGVATDKVDTAENTGLYLDNVSEESQVSKLPDSENGSTVLALVKLLAALVAVIAGIYGFIYILRKMMGQKFSGNRKNNLLEVMETTYVAQKKSVSLVRFAGRAVLLGISDNGICALAELNEDETSDILAEIKCEDNSSAGFVKALSGARAKMMNFNVKGLRALNNPKSADRPQTA